ncbi:histidine kinase [Nocardiopsis sinuspersici]|uniref:histidine kinase n=1 Tax=Nocardiopsis sinuspersici TaxID=501010 RepID=A0A1V3BXJ8_9ACTN|nr:histidine kinase [Nocardiopsis sinuspersici]
MHPHSQDPGRKSDREGGQHTAGDASEASTTERGGDPVPPATGPFSGSAENGYRPSTRVSVPNPYTTTRRVNVDDVDTGATPVGQWRGVGLDEPEPRPPHIPATTDAMTDTPSQPERAERPEAPAAHTQPFTAPAPEPAQPQQDQGQQSQAHNQAQGPQQPQGPQQSQGQQPQEPQQPQQGPQQPQGQPPQGTEAPTAFQRHDSQQPQGGAPQGGETYQQPPRAAAWGGQEPAPQQPYQAPGERPAAPAPPQVQGQHGYAASQPGAGQTGHDPYAAYGGPYQQAPGAQYGNPHEQRWQEQHHPQQAPPTQGYAPAPPQYGGYAPYPQGQPAPYPQQAPYPQGHPASYPMPYPPQPLVSYQSAYPAPFQPPGYVFQGQPVFYPGQHNPYGHYGQPVQHVIVLTAGQPPKVVSAESASMLFAEHAETTGTESEDAREDRALTRAEPDGADTEKKRELEKAADPRPEPEEEPAAPEPAAEEPAAEAAPSGATEKKREELQAALSNGGHNLLNEALAGLAMRDLSLVDALLEMVEDLETDSQDPDLLDKLFQIDNFATRMRRNGENFLVLTGHDGGESDAHDEIVPLLDVARAATSEIKDYPRVRMGKIPQTSITGMAADDISHLLAELLDNATANSPEHSQVVISAQEMDDGRLMVVVEDEGVGIPEAQLVELNKRLGGEPVLDDEVPRHMGLYVASRIARRHGLETRLESRSFRGVNAYTIIPKELLRVATPRTPGQARTSTVPASAPATPATPATPAPAAPTAPKAPRPSVNGSAKPPVGDASAVTSAGLPRRSATPHGSPLRMMPRPGGQGSDNKPKTRDDTPPKLSGEARAKQIRDELGDFFDGEREALEGPDESGNDKK